MPRNNKVLWSEGMFLRPQHFQQQDRYLETRLEERASAIRPFSWGIKHLVLQQKLLEMGKIAIAECRGIMPDGTPFNMPEDDELPQAMDVPKGTRDAIIYLALPLQRDGVRQVNERISNDITRYFYADQEAFDHNANDGGYETIEVSRLRLRVMLSTEETAGYAILPIGRIVEIRDDGAVQLDTRFIATTLSCQATPQLRTYLDEAIGMIRQRADSLASRFGGGGPAGAAGIADFLMLQILNRYEPLLQHYVSITLLHPETLYKTIIELIGELSTITHPQRRPEPLPRYQHENLASCFIPVMAMLNRLLSTVLEQNAISIPIEARKFGVHVARIPDRGLLTSASFVLAVKADVAPEELRNRFPPQVKIGPVELIRDLVNNQLPGIIAQAMPAAPRQLPYHAGYHYFELDRNSEYWKQLGNSSGFAFHVSGDFPGLSMEFWAIRG
jgi:type VI secretion system protein ImpJ